MKYWGRQQQPQWGKIQGIPSDFQDGKIDWNEVKNKPSTFAPNPDPLIKEATFAAIEFDGNAGVNYIDFHVRGEGAEKSDYDARILALFHDNTVPLSTESAFVIFPRPLRFAAVKKHGQGFLLSIISL